MLTILMLYSLFVLNIFDICQNANAENRYIYGLKRKQHRQPVERDMYIYIQGGTRLVDSVHFVFGRVAGYIPIRSHIVKIYIYIYKLNERKSNVDNRFRASKIDWSISLAGEDVHTALSNGDSERQTYQ